MSYPTTSELLGETIERIRHRRAAQLHAEVEHGIPPAPCAEEAAATARFIRWFSEIGMGDVGLVGGKNAYLV